MAMHRPKTVYLSYSGTAFDTPEQAENATSDHLCALLGRALQPLVDKGKLSHADRFEITTALAGNSVAIGRMCKELAPVLNWIITNADDNDHGTD